MELRNFKLQDKKFAENGKEKLFPNGYSFIGNLRNAKTNDMLKIQI